VLEGLGGPVSEAVVDGLVAEGILVRSKSGKVSMGNEYKRIEKEVRSKGGAVNGGVNDSQNDRVNDSLNDSVNATYLIIRTNPGIQRKAISELTGKSIPTIDRHIAILVREGLIEHKDSDKTGGYYPL
jgi:predicted transcriptional regulator